MKIGLDVDGVCLEFDKCFIEECKKHNIEVCTGDVWNFFDQDIRCYDIFKNLSVDFWENLTRMEQSLDLNFTPSAYISHRSCPEEVTKRCLLKNGFPDAPVIHVRYTEDKIKVAKQLGIDTFVDDRGSTVLYFLENSVNAYVLNHSSNAKYNLPRIYTLGELGKMEKTNGSRG